MPQSAPSINACDIVGQYIRYYRDALPDSVPAYSRDGLLCLALYCSAGHFARHCGLAPHLVRDALLAEAEHVQPRIRITLHREIRRVEIPL